MLLYPYKPWTIVLSSKIPVVHCKSLVLLLFSDGTHTSNCSVLLSVYVLVYVVLLDLFFVAFILSTFSQTKLKRNVFTTKKKKKEIWRKAADESTSLTHD